MDLLLENKRMLDRSTRAIETKKQGLQAEEKKLIAEMFCLVCGYPISTFVPSCVCLVSFKCKVLRFGPAHCKHASFNNNLQRSTVKQAAVKVMAKDLIRTRYQITKFYALKSQLQGVSLKIQFIWDSFSKTGFGYKRPELDMVD
ncbi:vacuolar protein sorting-associated protein 2 [Musa troglodytarum]|uniref:Vacuolar protein sorting-associated protein 2 n=1 Tax=Musa troglodytarum TaxID=320322 RepID=A0A9E7JNB6_9LILI|nr:vacuolar protein sorting-associated protein 2 [Musa troglodytarum]